MRFLWTFLGSLAALLFTAIILVVAASFGLFALSVQPPAPQAAVAKQVPNCSIPQNQPNLQAVNANTTGGVYHARRITIPQGMQIRLTSTLILVADDHLQVDGIITMNAAAVRRGRLVNIILVCRNCNVVIGAQGQVGSMVTQAPAGPNSNRTALTAIASGGAGTNGGYVKIVAPSGSIDIQGTVEGFGGGDGGNANAIGAFAAAPGGLIRNGGEAVAVGGQAGAGGDVKLCAYEAVNVAGRVRGGLGGQGGNTTATAVNGKDAYARGGPSNEGGDVLIEGLSPTMQVFNTGTIVGGAVLWAGNASSTGGPGFRFGGGDAESIGGPGHQGGTVTFVQCTVARPVGTINSRVGGDGGFATARAGIGASGRVIGWSGGDATATGGNGGTPGATPQIPTPTGIVAGGVSRGGASVGTGGRAMAIGGSGGTTATGWGRGGSSGTGNATGGTGGQSGTPATPVSSPAVGPTGATGGTAVPAPSPGTP